MSLLSVKQDGPCERNWHEAEQGPVRGTVVQCEQDVPYAYLCKVTKYMNTTLYGKGVDSELIQTGCRVPRPHNLRWPRETLLYL